MPTFINLLYNSIPNSTSLKRHPQLRTQGHRGKEAILQPNILAKLLMLCTTPTKTTLTFQDSPWGLIQLLKYNNTAQQGLNQTMINITKSENVICKKMLWKWNRPINSTEKSERNRPPTAASTIQPNASIIMTKRRANQSKAEPIKTKVQLIRKT